MRSNRGRGLAGGPHSMRHDSGGAKVVGRWRDSCAARWGGAEAVGGSGLGEAGAAAVRSFKQKGGLRLVAGGARDAQAGEAALAASHGPQRVRSARDEPNL